MNIVKYDAPNSMVSEISQYNILFEKGASRTSSGSGSFVSTSSGVTYTYTSGEQDLFTQLQTALASYMTTASYINSITDGSYNYISATPTSTNVYSATPTLGLLVYNESLTLKVKFAASNTGDSTLNIDSLGAKSIKKLDHTGKIALIANDIVVNGIHTITYDGTDFILINPAISTAQIYNNSYMYGASATSNDTYAITLSPVPLAYSSGMIVNLKVDVGNTGGATINVNSLGAKTIKKIASTGLVDLVTGDMIAGGIYTLYYDGTYFILSNPTSINSSIMTAAGDIIYASGANTPAKLAKGGNDTLFGVNGSGNLAYLSPSFESGSWSESGTLSIGTYTKTITLTKRGLFGVARLYNNTTRESMFVAFGQGGGAHIFGQTQYGGANWLSGMSAGFQDIGVSYTHYINFSSVYISGTSLVFTFSVTAQNASQISVNWGCLTL